MREKFTDIAVKKFGAGMHWDLSTPAFGLRVGKRSRTFLCVKSGGIKITIGRYPAMSLQEARRRAKGLLVAKYERVNPAGYLEAVERFLKHMEGELRRRTHHDYGLILRRFHFVTTEVSSAEVAAGLEKIESLSARASAYTVLKIFFNWAVRHDYVQINPLGKLKKPRVPSARERVLTDSELAAIWKGCEGFGKFGAIIRLLMVTGQRKGQFAGLREEWVDWKNKRFVFPASAMKAKQAHTLPFSHLSEFIMLGQIPEGGLYFYGAPGSAFNAWSKSKIRLDRLVPIDPWTIHDLRRTWSTNAARLDIPPHLTERVLSHVAPEGKVAAIYNRFKYESEMREAMAKMSTFISSLVAA